MTIFFSILALCAFWLGLSGHYTPLFFGLGGVSVLLVVLMKTRLATIVPLRSIFLDRTRFKFFPLLRYLSWLGGQIVASNLAVAKIILSPRLKIEPHFFSVPVSQYSLMGEVLFANSITLTPGTLSVETKDREYIIVHALTQQSREVEDAALMGEKVTAIEKIL